MKEIRASILTSLFKRKGGEGIYTKIIKSTNIEYEIISDNLLEGEKGIIIYYKSEREWFWLSCKRIRYKLNANAFEIFIKDIKKVSPAIDVEFKNRVLNKNDFSVLKIVDSYGNIHYLKLESGLPYRGIYQVLSYLVD